MNSHRLRQRRLRAWPWFDAQFRRTPVGRHVISLCDGTACHVKGAVDIHDAFDIELGIPKGDDTDPIANIRFAVSPASGAVRLHPRCRWMA